MLATFFAYPELLPALLATSIGFSFLLFAFLRRKQMTARLANPLLLRRSILVKPGVRRWKAFCLLIGLTLVAIACAGPQWGLDKSTQVRKGRDVIVVLDLSRSMSAEQPSRRSRALQSLADLADKFAEHGGNRVALVAFAARPRLLFPLTHDCEHLRHTLALIEVNDIPKLSVEDPVSGTRIGAALKLAAESIDSTRTNRPIVVLLSDGDDPADDAEWQQGVAAVKEKHLRVHVVGIGDPKNEETILVGGELLEYDGKLVKTRLHEKVLREIATETGGEYLPAHSQALPLGDFVLHLLDADELREETPADDALPIHQLRYAWFLLPALFFFLLPMLLSEGPSPMKSKPARSPRPRTIHARTAALLVALVAIVSVSAADPPEAEALIRQGNDAFARGEYKEAVEAYERAERLTLDPGQVSFNKAAAYYRLERYRDAIDGWRRVLEDDRIAPERRARASFYLGNALVQYAGDQPQPLAEAVASYRKCLLEPDLPRQLREDARHNLAYAQMRWREANANQPREKDPAKPKEPDYPKDDPKEPKKNGDPAYVPVDPHKDGQHAEKQGRHKGKKSTQLSAGSPVHLPENDQIVPLAPEATLAALEEHARRIAAARRAERNPPGPASLTKKDW
jgi:Ca-activated chloride channel family protein